MYIVRLSSLLCVVAIVVLLGVLMDVPARHSSITADHEDPSSHLTDPRERPLAGGRIVRNAIEGRTIRVCSLVYPESTKIAIARWNSGRHSLMKDVFVFETDDPSLLLSREQWCGGSGGIDRYGITGVVILRETIEYNCKAAGCINRTTPRPSVEWDTYVGRIEIYIGDYDTGSAMREVLDDGDLRVTRTITHELGHVFGLGNWQCGDSGQVGTMPRVFTRDMTIMGPSNGMCSAAEPQPRDQDDFRSSYVPIAPIARQDYSATMSPNSATVTWDAYRVHVEKGFAVERKDANGDWVFVGMHDPLPLTQVIPNPVDRNAPWQQASQVLTGQVPGTQCYRVVSLTDAPLQNRVAASGEIEIDVQAPPAPIVPCSAPGPVPTSTDPGDPPTEDCTLSAPSGLRVTNVTGTSATLT